MSPVTTANEKRTLFQRINFFIPYLYTIGILMILLWMAAAAIALGVITFRENPAALLTLTADDSVTADMLSGNSWLDVLIKPILASDFNQIIFKGLFMLLVWMLLFLVIPLAFKRLIRFKFFNLEIEVDAAAQTVIETIEVSAPKAKLMAYLSSSEATDRTIAILDAESASFQDVLTYFLEEIQAGYKKSPLDTNFSFQIYTNSPPSEFDELVSASRESATSVISNKADPDNVAKKSYFVYAYQNAEREYITVISSYTRLFDLFDQYLFETLHHTVTRNQEYYELLIAVASMDANA